MAWRCSGRTNAELVNNLYASRIIRTTSVYEAMLATDRALYTSSSRPYEDAPQVIPAPDRSSRVTISAPHMHAHALESIAPYLSPPPSPHRTTAEQKRSSRRVLDVGCGSGYLTACFARMLGEQDTVVGVDHAKYLVDLATKQVRSDGNLAQVMDRGRLKIVYGDGRHGYLPYAPYSVIHVGAAAATVPDALLDQLDSPGILFVPVGEQGGEQYIYVIKKDENGIVSKERSHGVRYVPLTDSDGT